MELDDLGQLQKVLISTDSSGLSADWFLGKIVVEDVATKHTYEFPCNRWLGKNKEDKKEQRELLLNTGCTDPPFEGTL